MISMAYKTIAKVIYRCRYVTKGSHCCALIFLGLCFDYFWAEPGGEFGFRKLVLKANVNTAVRTIMINWKKTLLATASGLVLAGAAHAADLPLRAPAAIPYSNWTGGYIGAHVGVGSQHSTCRPDFNADAGGACASYAFAYYSNTWTASDTSAVAGVQGGYDWQHRNFVYGIAADWSWTGMKARAVGCSGSCSYQAKVDWLASFRGRAGLAVDDTLIYVTGGLALGGVKDKVFGVPPALYLILRSMT